MMPLTQCHIVYGITRVMIIYQPKPPHIMMPHTQCHIVYGITRVMIIWRSLLIVATPYAPLSVRLSFYDVTHNSRSNCMGYISVARPAFSFRVICILSILLLSWVLCHFTGSTRLVWGTSTLLAQLSHSEWFVYCLFVLYVFSSFPAYIQGGEDS